MVAGTDSQLITELVRGVRSEITAILAAPVADADKIALRAGTRIAATGATNEYVFSVRGRSAGTAAGDRFLIRPSTSREPWERATAAPMPDGRFRVQTAADLGPSPGDAELRPDDTDNLEKLAERIAGAAQLNSPVNMTVAGWLLGDGTPRIGRCADIARFVRGYREAELNERQRMAIEHALASDVTFVWGPPGTGKTDVVSRIVEGCVRQGLRVLFVAPTHVAVDQALERVCGLLEAEDGFDSGLVQRLGEITASLAERYGSYVVAQQITARLAAGLAEQESTAIRERSAVRAEVALHEQVLALSQERAELIRRAQQADGALSAALSATARAEHALHASHDRLIRLGTGSGRRRQRKIDEAREQLLRDDAAAGAADRQRLLAQEQACALRDAVESVEARIADVLPRLAGIDRVENLRQRERRLTDELSHIAGELRAIDDAVRGRCRVMGTTVAKAVGTRVLMDTIDVVIIDEAGMVNLPSAWCVAGLARSRVVVAGDFRQLPAVTFGSGNVRAAPHDQEHSRRWVDRDAFTSAGLVDDHGTVRPDARMICLNTQYRMRLRVCDLVNAVAYRDQPLRTGRADTSRLPPSRLVTQPVILVDTTKRRIPDPGSSRRAHTTNPVHEAVIHELVRGLQYDRVLPARKSTDIPAGARATDRLAVITPYRDQVRALRTSLKLRFAEDFDGLVDTVHRFQGSQRPLVVIDTVAGAGRAVGRFYEGTGPSSATTRLLNVALSRAQDHLVVIADVGFLSERLPQGSDARVMLHELLRHAHRLDVDDLVPVRSAADLGGLSAEELARPAFFPADEVPRAIEWDIARAARSIDIYCPFLNPGPVRRWLKHLAPRASAGVRVTVHTRPHEPGTPAAGLVGELAAVGCGTQPRDRMHEKVVIFDDTVLWHGSLNLLASPGPTDLMMRFADTELCERVRRIMTTARMDRPAWTPRQSPAPVERPQASGPGRVAPGDVVDGRLYLDVPYAQKDEAKRVAGARWDRERRLWHVDSKVARSTVAAWLPGGGAG